jgi:PIN domain nuclease of toxin-antitoxin system
LIKRWQRDPFDRLIISQALIEKIPIVSVDKKFDDYGVDTIW